MSRRFAACASTVLVALGLLAGCEGQDEGPGFVFLERSETFLPDDSEGEGRTLEIGDLDGDGRPEIIVGSARRIEVWSRDATRRFRRDPLLRLPETTIGAHEIRLVDLDADADLDIVLASRDDGLAVWIQRSQGNFDDETERRLPSGLQLDSVSALEVLDLDLDGTPDLFVSGTGGTRVLLNRTRGFFRDPAFNPLPGELEQQTETGDAAFADLDGDGDADLIVDIGGQVELLEQRAEVTFQLRRTALPRTESLEPRRYAVADLDGDQDLDIVVASEGQQVEARRAVLLLNEGEQRFTDRSTAFLPRGEHPARDVLAADLDLDGDQDLLLATDTPSGVEIFLNEEAGFFNDQTRLLLTEDLGPVERIRLFDIDGDGDLDILAVRSEGRTVLLENQLLDLGPETTPTATASPGPDATPTAMPTVTPTP